MPIVDLFQSNNSNSNEVIPSWLVFVITFLGSVFNLISILTMCYKKRSSFIWGILAVVCFGLKAFNDHLWGLVIIYWGYYIISQIIMFFWWGKKIKEEKEIIPQNMKWWLFIAMFIILLGLSIVLFFVRVQYPQMQSWIAGGNQPQSAWDFFINISLDSFILVFTLSVVYFVAKRYIQRWIINLWTNALQVILWCINIILAIVNNKSWLAIASSTFMLFSAITLFIIAMYSWKVWSKSKKDK